MSDGGWLARVRHPERVIAAGLFVLLVATSRRYGWPRDKLYFLAAVLPARGPRAVPRP